MDTERLYEIAAKELETNAPRKGLYARAFSEAMGDDAKARAIYIRLRAEQLRETLGQKQAAPEGNSRLTQIPQEPRRASAVLEASRGFSTKTAAETVSVPNAVSVDAVDGLPAAGPWRRLLARLLDTWLYWIALIPVAFLLGISIPNLDEWLENGRNTTIFAFLLFSLSPVIEALLFAVFRDTPGKALLGVRVLPPGGSVPFGVWLSRSYRVWSQGLGFGLPLVNIVTMLFASYRLRERGTTSWDEALGFSVKAAPLSPSRVGVYVVLFVALALAWLVAGQLQPGPTNQATSIAHEPVANMDSASVQDSHQTGPVPAQTQAVDLSSASSAGPSLAESRAAAEVARERARESGEIPQLMAGAPFRLQGIVERRSEPEGSGGFWDIDVKLDDGRRATFQCGAQDRFYIRVGEKELSDGEGFAALGVGSPRVFLFVKEDDYRFLEICPREPCSVLCPRVIVIKPPG